METIEQELDFRLKLCPRRQMLSIVRRLHPETLVEEEVCAAGVRNGGLCPAHQEARYLALLSLKEDVYDGARSATFDPVAWA